MPEVKTEKTFRVSIEVAGDVATIRQVCRQFCYEIPCCVTVTPTTFVYTAGEESGAKVGLLNYPRFPTTPQELKATAATLGLLLMLECCQSSVLIVADDETTWHNFRGEVGRT